MEIPSSLFPMVLFLHSWMRWAVVVLGACLLATSLWGYYARKALTRRDTLLRKSFTAAFDFQVTLGLGLYFGLSPLVRAAFVDFGAAMKSAPLRFFAVEHGVTMIVALVCVHAGNVWARRAPTPRGSHGRMAASLALAGALILVAIPWPGMRHGRPLFHEAPVQGRVFPSDQATRLARIGPGSAHSRF